MSKTIKVTTPLDATIEFNEVAVEVKKVRQVTEKKVITPGECKNKMAQIDEKIAQLQAEKAEVQAELDLITEEAKKVTNALNKPA